MHCDVHIVMSLLIVSSQLLSLATSLPIVMLQSESSNVITYCDVTISYRTYTNVVWTPIVMSQ